MEKFLIQNEINLIIKNSNTFLIHTHKNPDGDAIGSSLAMYNYLNQLHKDVEVVANKISTNFGYLSGFDNIKSEMSKEKYDCLIVLDCAQEDRLEKSINKEMFNNIISIDHHMTHETFGNVNLIDPECPATCQLVYDLIAATDYFIDSAIGECIYTGLITDTGGLSYSNVNPHTFDIAKKMLEVGVNISDISKRMFDTISINKFNVIKLTLSKIEIIDEKIAYVYLSKDELDAISNNEENIHEGLINYGRSISGVEVSIFIRQTDENLFKISMRSNYYVNVAEISKQLGGGGHIKAAGADVESADINELKDKIIKLVKEAI